ncbi:MAG: hypothetical protein K8S13_08505 [Desulfobacula sp.]|uniref:hypothetical protein n=1 Tax=Desulfobacula sp. TaxID=2593537 RepID=UPI0025C34361|nr:hypothetical protein [Desulfobacula sp.]MCD4719887.1 hypothetical protein [Desulfobacula sp.]
MTIKNNIPKKNIQAKKPGFCWFVVISIIFCELLAYTWIRTESAQTILRVSRKHETFVKKMSYRKALSVERDRLKSDDRITRIAKTRLNLSRDTVNQTIYMTDSLANPPTNALAGRKK